MYPMVLYKLHVFCVAKIMVFSFIDKVIVEMKLSLNYKYTAKKRS